MSGLEFERSRKILDCICWTNFIFYIFEGILFVLQLRDILRIKAVCHRNFWFCLINLFVFFMLTYVCSIMSSINCFTNPLFNASNATQTLSEQISYQSVSFLSGFALGAVMLVLIERAYATITYQTYEKSKNPVIPAIIVLLAPGMGALFVLLFIVVTEYNLITGILYPIEVIFVSINENLRMLRYAGPLIAFGGFSIILPGALIYPLRAVPGLVNNDSVSDFYYLTMVNVFIITGMGYMRFRALQQGDHHCLPNNTALARFVLWRRHNRPADGSRFAFRNAEGQVVWKVQNPGDEYFSQFQKVW